MTRLKAELGRRQAAALLARRELVASGHSSGEAMRRLLGTPLGLTASFTLGMVTDRLAATGGRGRSRYVERIGRLIVRGIRASL